MTRMGCDLAMVFVQSFLQMKDCASSNCWPFMEPGKLLSSGLGENSCISLKLVFSRLPLSVAHDCLKRSCLELEFSHSCRDPLQHPAEMSSE